MNILNELPKDLFLIVSEFSLPKTEFDQVLLDINRDTLYIGADYYNWRNITLGDEFKNSCLCYLISESYYDYNLFTNLYSRKCIGKTVRTIFELYEQHTIVIKNPKQTEPYQITTNFLRYDKVFLIRKFNMEKGYDLKYLNICGVCDMHIKKITREKNIFNIECDEDYAF